MPPDDPNPNAPASDQAPNVPDTNANAPASNANAGAASEPEARFVPAARFDTVVGQKYDAIRKAEAAEQRARELEGQLQALQARQNAAAPQPGDANVPRVVGPTPGEIDRLAELRARQINFNERCNESATEGRRAYNDFDAKVAELRRISPISDGQGQPVLPQSLVEAALETGRAHEVLYALGNDPVEADRIMSLSPTKQAVELARLAFGLEGKAKDADEDEPGKLVERARRVSSAPAPIVPRVGGNRGISVKDMDLGDPNLPIDEFMRRRDEEAARNRRSNGRFR